MVVSGFNLPSVKHSLGWVLMLCVLHSSPSLADHISTYQAQYLLQWQNRQHFLDSWLTAKQEFPKQTFVGLLEGHTRVSEGRRIARQVPAGFLTLDQLNRGWLEQAIDAYHRRDWHDSQHSMSQLTLPLNPLIASSGAVLWQAVAIQLQKPAAAPRGPASVLSSIQQYNQSLALINQGQHALAQPILQEVEASARNPLLKTQAQLLRAYSLAQTGQHQMALMLLQAIQPQTSLQGLHRQVQGLAHLEAGQPVESLTLLLELYGASEQQSISAANIQLLDQLRMQGAATQASLLASRWLLPLQQHYIALRQEVQQVSSGAFLNRMDHRRSGDAAEELVALFSKDARLLLTEIERINTLIYQLEQQIPTVEPEYKLFSRGLEHIKKLLLKHKDRVPESGAQLPAQIRNGDPQIRQLEARLSRLVGQPEPWQHRYVLLDGLAIWQEHKPFVNRWWKAANAKAEDPLPKYDFKAAMQELAKYSAEQLSKAELLAEIRVEEELPKLPILERRARAMLSQLHNQKRELVTALGKTLQFEPAKMIRETEHNLLWLSAQIAPHAHQFDQPEQQRWFSVAQKTASLPDQSTELPYELALSALQALVDNALNPDIKHQAMRHLADLKLLLAERIINGDPIPPRPDLNPGRAIALYQQLLEAEDPVIDRQQVLYQLAKASEFEGLQTQTLNTLEQLVREFPQTGLRLEVLFRIAELQFNLREYDLAAQSYQQVLQADQNGEYQDKAGYKRAWSNFKLGNYPQALEGYLALVERYWDKPQISSSEQALLDDTLRVTALTFAYMKGTQSLEQYFAQIGAKPYENQLYRNLAAYFEYKKRYNDAAGSYSAMAKRFPDSEEAPFYQSRVVAAFIDGGFPSKAWPAREQYIERFGVNSPAWQRADEAQRDRIREFLPNYLIDLAQRDHALAQQAIKGAKPTTEQQQEHDRLSDQALQWYDQFEAALPNHEMLPEMLFLKAEMLTDLGRHAEAAEHYQQVAYQHPDHSRSAEAGYAELLAYQTLNRLTPKDDPKAHRWQWLEIKQSMKFNEQFGDSPYYAKIQTKLAEDLLRENEYLLALTSATTMLASSREILPEDTLRLWRVIAHANFDTLEFAQAEKAYLTLQPLLKDDKEKQQIRRRLAESVFKQAEQARDAGDVEQALKHYQRVGSVVPNAHILAEADFDAAQLLMEMERWPQAISALQRFRRDHTQHPLMDTIDDKLVLAFEQSKDWRRAALVLERIFEREGKSDLGRDALWRAATLQERAEQPERAMQAYQRYIETFPKPHEAAMEARLKLTQIAVQLGDERTERRWTQAIVSVEKQAGADSTDRTLFIASGAALKLGKASMNSFMLQPLKLPLNKSLPKKRETMETSLRYLTQVGEFGLSQPTTEATVLIGRIYAEFAQALMSSERPAKLSELELEQYEILLEEQALPFEDLAIEAHELNISRIAQGVYTPAIETSLNELRQMMPARYAKAELVPEYSDAIQ